MLTLRYRFGRSATKRPKSSTITRSRQKRTGSASSMVSTPTIGTTADSTGFDLDNFEDYDCEESERSDSRIPTENLSPSQQIYMWTCKENKIVPVRYFLRHLPESKLVMRSHNLGIMETRACATALLNNTEVEELDLSANNLGPIGCMYISDMIEENNFITELRLADNNIGSVGAKYMTDALLLNRYVKVLDLSGNKLVDADAKLFRTLLLCNMVLQEIYLGRNQFGEAAGEVLADVIGKNDHLRVLDLSWNYIRQRGAVAIGRAIGKNEGLHKLNLGWNGFGLEGTQAVSAGLTKNDTLGELDLSGNRLTMECAAEIVKGMKKNLRLRVLRVGDNPLTEDGALLMLTVPKLNGDSELSCIDFGEQSVNDEFIKLLKSIKQGKSFTAHFGTVKHRPDEVARCERALGVDNAEMVIREYTKIKNVNISKVFGDVSHVALDKEEVKSKLQAIKFPMTTTSVDKLLEKLTDDLDYTIDLGFLKKTSQDTVDASPQPKTKGKPKSPKGKKSAKIIPEPTGEKRVQALLKILIENKLRTEGAMIVARRKISNAPPKSRSNSVISVTAGDALRQVSERKLYAVK